MLISAGQAIGPYQVLAQLGAGGMGQVYRARDTRLGREVAIKVLPADFVADPARIARFEREAKTLAALNHPHIATLFGWEPIETQPGLAGATMLVMELVEGPTLHTKLGRGPLPLVEVVRIGREIADAVGSAHDRGVIHRDLKPANIKLTQTGSVKVLDFGIAKAIDETGDADVTAMLTEAGQIVGTPAYMSPEQTRGQLIDARTDIWAFGCLLFEMLTGRRAFGGTTRSDVVAAVLERDPDWALVPPNTPAGVRVLLRRCLQKDRSERLRAMADAGIILSDLGSASGSVDTTPARRALVPRLAVAALAAAGLTALAMWALIRPREVPVEQAQRYEIATPVASPINLQTTTPALALSPDGRRLSYVTDANAGSGGQLMVREVGDLAPKRVEGAPRARDHAFSPDGQWVVYLSTQGGLLAKVPVAGGAAVTLCTAPGTIRGPSWADDGSIVFSTNHPETGLLRVSSEGGTPVVLTKPDAAKGEGDHLFPSALPSGRGVLFVIHPVGAGDPELAVLDGRNQAIKRLVPGAAAARYLDGRLVYAVNGTLYARPFDLDRLEVTGEPVVMAEGVLMGIAGGAYFDVARNGTIVYVHASAASDPPRRLVWVDRSGSETALGAPDLPYADARLSPQGDRIAVALHDEHRDIHTWDIARRTMARVTTDPREELAPVWTADGTELIYSSRRSGGSILSRQIADGSASARQLMGLQGTTRIPTAVTNDGRYLLGNQSQSTLGFWELFVVPLDRPDDVRTGIQAQANFPATSPDGRFMAFQSGEAGSTQIYVRPFPRTDARRWQVSNAGGNHPVWSADSRELFYWEPRDPTKTFEDDDPGGRLMAVSVRTADPTFEWQAARPLFEGAPYHLRGVHPYDVSRDGQRWLMIKNLNLPRESGGRIVVMLNALRQ